MSDIVSFLWGVVGIVGQLTLVVLLLGVSAVVAIGVILLIQEVFW